MTESSRGSEVILFDHLCRASTRGKGAVLLISGPVGTGKTTLLQAMAVRAGRAGAWCFQVTGSAGERDHSFGLLDRLVQAMRVAGMADPFPGGLDPGQNFFAAMNRMAAAMREFAGGRTLVVAIDDIHFADEQSLRCLSYLIRRIESSRVVMVLTESSSYERDLADLRTETLHLPFCHRVRLARLPPADIVDQLRERLGGTPDEALVRFCVEVSGGIPLLLHALIDDRAAAPGPPAPEPGASFRQAVLRSLHRCTPSTAAAAQAIAVLGDYAAPALIAELGGVDLTLVEESIRDLQEMGLLGSEWFRHPQTRSAVLAGIPLPNLSGMHSRAAELLHENGAPALAVAEHLIAAQDGGKAPWRVAILGEAAREAMAAGDVDSAMSSLRHAVGASTDEAERARAGVLLADAQWQADPSRAARRLSELAQDARAGLLSGADIPIAVNQLLWWGEFAEADELLRLGGAEDGDDSGLAHLWAFFRRAGLGPEPRGEPGVPGDSPLADSGPMAAATYLSSAASLALDRGTADRADQTLLGVRAGSPLTPALYALVVLVQTGRSGEAIAWCERLLKEDWISLVPMRRVMIGTVRAVAALRDGDSETAMRGIQEAFRTTPPAAWGVVVGLPLSIGIRAGTDLQDAQAVRSYLAVPVPPAMLDTPFALPYLLSLGRYHRAMNHPESAFMHSLSCVELMARWAVDDAGIANTLAGLGVSTPSRGTEDEAEYPFGVGNPAGTRASGKRISPAQPEADAKLTEAEQRVAELAAGGSTNRQIAERLFITVSTVEQHLTKIYRKLDVRSRSGLRRHSY